jgi:NADH-quinone oxidoreductase subunit E
MAKTLSEKAQKKFEWLVTRYPKRRAALLPTLRIIESEFGCIDQEGMRLAAELIGCAPAEVLAVVTFYTHYKREVDGRHVVWVCNTLPCALRGARAMTTAIEEKLGVETWGTTADGRFTLKKAECLASCDTAPCLQIGEEHFENVNTEQLDEIFARFE